MVNAANQFLERGGKDQSVEIVVGVEKFRWKSPNLFVLRADAFEKKDWFRLRLPKIQNIFEVDTYGWMPANKTAQGGDFQFLYRIISSRVRFAVFLVQRERLHNERRVGRFL